MKTVKGYANIAPYHSKIFEEYFENLNICFIDIETTGLYPNSSKVIVGGLMVPKEKGYEIIQHFADNESDEETVLKAYGEAISTSDVLITYNGRSFDLPFLKQRFSRNRLLIDLDTLQSFDLYRSLHYYSMMREVLPNLKQKSIENFLGISHLREDEISGKESTLLYEKYLQSGSKEIARKILLHNRDDLIQLASILKILDKLDLHRILFHEGFTVSENHKKIYVKNIAIEKNRLTVTGRTKNVELDYYSFETGYQATHKSASKKLTLYLPFVKQGKAEYIDLELIDANFNSLERHPSYINGYLILRENNKINYAEINKAIKIILSEILKRAI